MSPEALARANRGDALADASGDILAAKPPGIGNSSAVNTTNVASLGRRSQQCNGSARPACEP